MDERRSKMPALWEAQGMTDTTTCSTCRYFRPAAQNPTAAMGRCLHDARHGWFFAGERHRCADHSPEVREKPEAPA